MENKPIKRILLIDDDMFIVRLLTLLLTKSGYEIVTANDGKQAITILSEQQFDLLILDLMMPEMDGLVFLQWLRLEAMLTLPIIILTAMVAADTEKQVLNAGGTVLIYKPIKVPDLIAKIQQLEQTH